MKIVYMILTLSFSIIPLAACSSTYQANDFSTGYNFASGSPLESESSLQLEQAETVSALAPDSISGILFNEIPELNDIAAFIDRQSKGQARMVIQAFDPIDIWESSYPHYPVYVGEEWDDGHRINWYWFYVCENPNSVLVNSYYTSMTDLSEWRKEDSYLQQMNLIQIALSDEEYSNVKLDNWIGTYSFSEQDNLDQKMVYIVTLYKIIDKFYAKIELHGLQTGVILFAKVQGDESKIDFIYHDVIYNWFDNFTDYFNQGDVLFSFSKNGSEIYTRWDTLQPLLDLSKEPNTICFHVDDGIKRSVTDNSERYANFIETDEPNPNIQEAINAYNEFLNSRSVILHGRDLKLVDDIMGISFEYPDRKYTLYDVNGNGVPELILQGQRLYILSYNDGELSVWFTDERFGGSSYFVNGGNLYHRHSGISNKLMHAYEEFDDNGNRIRYYNVDLYAKYDHDTETDILTYIYSEDEEERNITEEEYDELVLTMSNDDQIKWHGYNYPESTFRFVR